jgi:ribosomal protein L32
MVCKDAPDMLSYLLNNPPFIERLVNGMEEAGEKPTVQLMSKVAKSMIEWTKTGFSKVDDLTYERRIKACMNCHFLKDPPQNLAYKFATLMKREHFEKKICALCGCVISNKAKLTHEVCPLDHPTLKGKSRWEE